MEPVGSGELTNEICWIQKKAQTERSTLGQMLGKWGAIIGPNLHVIISPILIVTIIQTGFKVVITILNYQIITSPNLNIEERGERENERERRKRQGEVCVREGRKRQREERERRDGRGNNG